jgi:outer membrane autotransporter protein
VKPVPPQPALNPQSKALAEAQAAGAGFLAQGQDWLATQGLRSLKQSLQSGGQAFVVSGYDRSRYATGSHIDVKGFNLLAGPAWGKRLEAANLALGAFVEAGQGNYNSYNSFDSLPAVRGHGRIQYYGAGVIGSLEQDAGLFVDGALRVGRIQTEFKSRDIPNSANATTHYHSGSLYYGAQANLGYAFKPNDKTRLEVYARYAWNRQEADSVSVLGDKLNFSAINSQRLRSGVRYVHSGGSFAPYFGLAHEREFDGKAKASALGETIDAPSLQGDTTIGEAGFSYRATPTAPLSIDFGIQGYTGKREGSGGSFRVNYQF